MIDVHFDWAAACPFCHDGHPAMIDMGTDFWITCRRCGANGPSGKNVAEALQRWNHSRAVSEHAMSLQGLPGLVGQSRSEMLKRG